MSKYNIIRFDPAQSNKLIALMQSNIPAAFAPGEEKDFYGFLESETEDYFVVEHEGKIIACGGINYEENKTKAVLSWDMIHPEFQGKGIGRLLVKYRLDFIRTLSGINTILVDTSQMAVGFYLKMGFQLIRTEKDYWAKGYDLYAMEYHLNS